MFSRKKTSLLSRKLYITRSQIMHKVNLVTLPFVACHSARNIDIRCVSVSSQSLALLQQQESLLHLCRDISCQLKELASTSQIGGACKALATQEDLRDLSRTFTETIQGLRHGNVGSTEGSIAGSVTHPVNSICSTGNANDAGSIKPSMTIFHCFFNSCLCNGAFRGLQQKLDYDA